MADEDEFFPSSPRVVYQHSPLNEVICQVRFPPVLKIDAQPPAEFQERIRGEFPFFDRQVPSPIQGGVPPEIINMIGLGAQQGVQYVFRSESGKRQIMLGNSALAVTSHDYSRWESFAETVEKALLAVQEIYQPSFFQRIGLRYQNLLQPEMLGFGSNDWSSLLSENIVGELRHPQFGGAKVTEAQRLLRIVAENLDGVLLQHGIGRVQGSQTESYIIDIDCYTDSKTEAKDALSALSRFNVRARRAFRWCISDALHNALGPTDVVAPTSK
ncbi:TIGR04255 family protein [Rhizobium mongolense]|uniref:TIGR04255 family protein n=1 Tax=Rhizobium mongolense TaxID=57676 RepID=UPI0034A14FF5